MRQRKTADRCEQSTVNLETKVTRYKRIVKQSEREVKMVQLKAMWEPGWKKYAKGKDPQKVADEIFSISDTPTADEIVAMASDPGTESHDLFDWDDAIAGPKWRKEQAGKILQNLKVEFVTAGEADDAVKTYEPVRLFYGNPCEAKGYAAITTILGNKDMYTQLLERAKMEIKQFRKKYAMLKELGDLFDMIDRI